MARKKKEECKAAPAWLTSFGDLMSLLLTFFILLYSMSVISLDKFNLTIRGITEAFGGRKMVAQEKVISSRNVPLDFPEMYPKVKNGKKIMKRLDETLNKLQSLGIDGEIETHGTMIRMRLYTDKLFAPGSAEPSTAAGQYIDELAKKLAPSEMRVAIEGYTDSMPIKTKRFANNWELSAERAVNVLRLFVEAGYEPNLLVAKGAGEYHPLESNATPQGRMRNRRIEFVIDLST